MRLITGIAIMLLTLGVAGTANASSLEKLLMPGKVASAHAKLEDTCEKCHNPTDRHQQTALCLDCHKDIRTDINTHRGFHGHGLKQDVGCQACHTDHKGRDADIVRFDRESFDHTLSGYSLTGKHVGVACDACHARGKPLRTAPTTCIGCHKPQDVHNGKLGTDCAACHTTAGFKAQSKFDHSKTHFALTGAHGKVACESCHRDPSFKGAPLECNACHARDDVHHGGRGPNCASCHGTVTWKNSSFDHFKVGHFALNGAHAKVTCAACHRSGDMKAKIPKDCAGCHSADDRHAGRFGSDCAACHNESRWKDATYDHAVKANFPLRGKHEKVACNACHKVDAKQEKLGRECKSCHAQDDVHRNSMGANCASCHVESGWKDKVYFDHGMTHFPLVGLHASVACEECHVTQAFRGTAKDCFTCHKAKDVHKGSLGKACNECHNPNGWTFWQFDHGQKTHFALTGAHKPLACEECHKEPADKVKLSMECASCHLRQDVHQGRFGRDCDRCHDTRSFKQPRVLH